MLRGLLGIGIAICTTLLCGPLKGECHERVRIDLGYRQDNFRRSIAGPMGVPNILSELDWEKLHMLEASAFGWYSNDYIPYLRWAANYAVITQGSVRDSDFCLDDRLGEFSRALCLSDRGTVVSLSGGLGWPYFFAHGCWKLQLAPILGIAWDQQHLHLHEGRQIVNARQPSAVGRIRNLNSEYKTHWWGAWAGIDAVLGFGPLWTYTSSFEYHFGLPYRARGDWNLRPELQEGFFHRAIGHGWLVRLGVEFAFRCNWLFSCDFKAQEWRTGHGTDYARISYIERGSKKRNVCLVKKDVKASFNGAQWDSYSLSGGLVYRY